MVSRKRGRPPLMRPAVDYGTPELQQKRLRHETTETLDLCLQRGILSLTQHQCGIRLRWLHSLCYGTAAPQTIQLTDAPCAYQHTQHPQWRQEREQEYHDALERLEAQRLSRFVLNISVYDEKPLFLTTERYLYSSFLLDRAELEISWLQNGMDILAHLWRVLV